MGLTAAAGLFLAACGGLANPEGWSTPSFQNDTLYYFPDRDTLVAVEVDEQGPRTAVWSFPDTALEDERDIDVEAVYGDLVVTDDAIYFAGWEGHVYAVEPEEGRLLWTTHNRISITGSVVGGVLHHDGRLFFGTTEGHFYALEAETGTIAPGWPEEGFTFDKGIWATPVLLGDRIFIGTMTGEVHAISPDDGSPVWADPFESGTGAIPELALIDERLLFVPTLGKTVYLLDPDTGQEAYPSFLTEDWVWTTPAYGDDFAYFGDFAGLIHALDITSGRDRWTFDTGAKVKAGPAIVGDVLVVADREPVVHFIDIDSGERLNAVPLQGAGTVRANVVERGGVAYVLTTNGRLFRAEPDRLAVTEVSITGAPN